MIHGAGPMSNGVGSISKADGRHGDGQRAPFLQKFSGLTIRILP